MALEALSSAGRWVAYCSAAAVDAPVSVDQRGRALVPLSMTLQIGSNSWPIEGVLRVHPKGRYLVVRAEGAAWLVDAQRQNLQDLSSLSPDVRDDALPEHRSFAFVDAGLALLSSDGNGWYLPLPESENEAPSVSRDELRERAIPIRFAEKPVWRLEGRGSHLWARTVAAGTRPAAWPAPLREVPEWRCGAPYRPFSVYPKLSAYRPDQAVGALWAHLPKKKINPIVLESAPGFVFGFQQGWVRREDSGRLLYVSAKTQRQIASERCGARVLGADEKTGLFLISCEHYAPVEQERKSKAAPQHRFELYLVKPGYVRSLHADVARTGVDILGVQGPRRVPLRPGATPALVDWDARRLIELPDDAFVLSSGPAGTLLRQGTQLRLWHPERVTTLPQPIDELDPVLVQGASVAVGDWVYHLGEKLTQTRLPHAPLWISPQGHALVASRPGSPKTWPEGPFLFCSQAGCSPRAPPLTLPTPQP